jgi:hypothetical protein
MMPSVLRFMFLVAGPPLSSWIVAGAVVVFGGYIAWLGSDAFYQTAPIALLLQLFAASTGYRAKLRHGHFDPLLVAAPNRWEVAAAHWLVSIGLGAAVWIGLLLIDLVAHPHQLPTAMQPAVIVLFLYLSTVAWAISVVVGRMGGALIWLALLVALTGSSALQSLRISFIPNPSTPADLARSIESVLIVPAFLLIDPARVSLTMVALVGMAALAAWVGGALAIRTLEAALVQS